MLPVSADFLAAVRASHRIVSRARIITPGVTGADPAGTDLRIVDGTVTLDATADIRGSLDLTLAEPWPAGTTTGDVVPYGTELAVSRGVVFGNGRIERAPLGIYRIISVEQEDAPDGPLRVSAQDRMAAIVDARLMAPVQYDAATTYGAVLLDLVQEVLPDQPIEWDDATNLEALGRKVVAEEDRFAFLNELVTAVGKVWWFDYRGVLVIRDPPDPTAAVFDVDAGANGVLVALSRALTREGMYNAVVATGEGADQVPPAFGVAYDMDPDSVTYWEGDFGKVPRFFSSPLLTTDAKARNAARSMLLTALGLPYSVSFGMVPNPALEPLDAVRVVHPPRPTNTPHVVTELHVLEQLTIGLGAATEMSATTRKQTLSAGQIGESS